MLKILFPTDFSECSSEALRYAVSLASESSGTLVILHVVEPMSPYLVPEPNSDAYREKFLHLLKSMLADKPSVSYEERAVIASPVAAILSMAETECADVIVMGTTGRTGVKRLLLGSVAEEVVRKAPCPVLTLKAGASENVKRRVHATPVGTWPVEIGGVLSGPDLTLKEAEDNPALALLLRGIHARASDIHLDPVGLELSVRFRIDGRLQGYCKLDQAIGQRVATQLKLLANLDIADPFHPQEGRLNLPDSLQGIDVRITTVPVALGEAISLRLLSRDRLVRPLQELGLSVDSLEMTKRMLDHGEGLILVTGPTGSGKTTTMYSMLRALDDGTRHIVSIEDPVEFVIPGFRQVSVDSRHNITLTKGLRTLLRLDPDVVFVSEIRDAEAAEVGMRAASSGKYVFSSLHTRDVASTITALRDLHIDNRSLGGNLTGIVSQRLIRRLCGECCRSDGPTAAEVDLFAKHSIVAPQELSRPVGCPRCRNTGYFDRTGVFEIVIPVHDVMRAIDEGLPEDELRAIIRANGTRSLESDALEKVAQGITSIEEFDSMTSIKLR